jgi:predicted nucleotidyltransferase
MAAAWRDRLRKRIETVALMLAENFGASRIVLFGSFARAEASPGSDVDLLTSGVPSEGIIEATAAAERIIGGARVDLVPTESARPVVRKRAESEGVVLYGS